MKARESAEVTVVSRHLDRPNGIAFSPGLRMIFGH